jgi:hypothetical protein
MKNDNHSTAYKPLAEEINLRDYFAGKALQGFCSAKWTKMLPHDEIVGMAFHVGELMYIQRQK